MEAAGIQEIADSSFAFEAPETGFHNPQFVIDMPKSMDSKSWSDRATKHFWVHFTDGTYGRISFEMIAGGDHFAMLDGYRNPTPNDRNLESNFEAR